MDKLMRGKIIADKITESAIEEVSELKKNVKEIKLTIVRVGSNPDDMAYERGAINRCKKIGIHVESIELPENVSQDQYVNLIEWLNDDKDVNGILTLRPLPKHIDENLIKDIINPLKDVDGFNPINFSKIANGEDTGFAPCTPSAVIEIIKENGIELKGKHVVVVGRSMVVGKPLSMMLLNEDATITVCHSKTKDLESITSNADILITAIGRAKMIDKYYVNKGVTVIDVGINVDDDGKLCGDVDIDDVMDFVDKITPVPGGVGSITTSILARNVIKACKLQQK